MLDPDCSRPALTIFYFTPLHTHWCLLQCADWHSMLQYGAFMQPAQNDNWSSSCLRLQLAHDSRRMIRVLFISTVRNSHNDLLNSYAHSISPQTWPIIQFLVFPMSKSNSRLSARVITSLADSARPHFKLQQRRASGGCVSNWTKLKSAFSLCLYWRKRLVSLYNWSRRAASSVGRRPCPLPVR